MINAFTGPYAFLSNFHIEPDGTHVEGEYQSNKSLDYRDWPKFKGATPAAAKRLGRLVTLRPDWEAVKLEIMYNLVRQKFVHHKDLRQLLFATYPSELIEGNQWGDTFWGVCRGTGSNELGKILMRVRQDLA